MRRQISTEVYGPGIWAVKAAANFRFSRPWSLVGRLARNVVEVRDGKRWLRQPDWRDWLNTQILNSTPKQLAGIIGFLAPLLVGPLAGVLKELVG